MTRYRPVSAQVLGSRFTELERRFRNLLINHNDDPTGQQGEDVPRWFDVMQRLKVYIDSHSNNGRAQANRANLREVQGALGAAQPPLGPGNPSLRSEIAAENPTQLSGPVEIGAGVTVRQVVEDLVADEDDTTGTGTATAGQRRRRQRTSGTTRRNRQRTGRNSTIQEDIDDGREQLGSLAESLSDLARSVTAPVVQPVVDRSLSSDPIGNLRSISESVTAIAAQLNSPERRQASRRLMASWGSLLDQYDVQNGFSANPETAAEAVAPANDVAGLPV